MAVPGFLLRKLYKRGSLRVMNDGEFALTLQNPLATATLVKPPHIVVNGILFPPQEVDAGDVDLAAITEENPFRFQKGAELDIRCKGFLLKWNLVHVLALTKEFGELDIVLEDEPAATCELPRHGEEE